MKEPTSAYTVSHNDVTNSNFKSYFPEIIKKLNNASHIAVDLEFTALGDIRSTDMNHRYVAMKRTAESASIVSFGLSIFRQIDVPKPPALKTAVSESFTTLSQPTVEKSKSEDPIDFNIASSQPILTKQNSILSKEEEEGLISSFMESDDEEFSFPVTSCSTTKITTILDDDDFSVTTTSIATTNVTVKESSVPEKRDETPIIQQYECDNFNFTTLKQGSIRLDTSTGQFLVDHGYSFDKLFSDGIPFTPFNEKSSNEFNDPNYLPKQDNSLRNLWKHLISVLRFHKIPLILHNGFYDLVYIYHSFIGTLPETFRAFIQLVSDSFPCGIYDTRFLASGADMNATFLSYVFGASDRLRQCRFGSRSTKEKPYFEVIVKAPILTNFSQSQEKVGQKRKRNLVQESKVSRGKKKNEPYCRKFSERGYCDLGHDSNSPMHDVQIILDHQFGPSKYPQVYTSQIDDIEGAHAAHFDAYMTGFSYCYFQQTLSKEQLKSSLNKMILSGINVPLTFPPTKTIA